MTSGELITIGVAGIFALFSALSGFFTWRNGTAQVSDSVINTYKAKVEQLEERVTSGEKQHKESIEEIGRLKGILEEKDKRISVLESVDLKKNPEFTQFMKDTTETLLSVKNFFVDMDKSKFVIVPAPQLNL